MNILFVTPFYTPQTGGVATFIDDARRFLAQRGHGAYVLRTGEGRTIRQCPANNDEHVHEFYMRHPWIQQAPLRGLLAFVVYFIPTLWRLGRYLRERNVQVVALEYPLGFMLYFLLLRSWMGIKIVTGLHGDDILSLHLLPRLEQLIVTKLILRADWVLAHSASLLGQAERILPLLKERRRSYLPYGIDCERLRNRASQPLKSISSRSGPYLLTVAKLYDRKGIDVLLRSIQQVKSALGTHYFLIAGDGPEEERLKQMARDLGVSEYVVFAGDVPSPQVPGLMKGCVCFVLPSRSEPFGIVLLEAMTFGKAILATRVGGIPEFVKDGHNGVLVASEDADALAAHIHRFLSNPGEIQQIGKNGLAVVENEYDYRAIIKRYEALFKQVIGNGSGVMAA